MTLLLPDPCDPSCPDEFKSRGKDLPLAMRGRPSKWDPKIKAGEGLRQASLRFISDFANWDNAAKAAHLETGRGLRHGPPTGGDTTGGGPLRQRSQPGRLLHPQGDTGGHPLSRAWPGRLADLYGPPSRTSRPPRTFPSERSDARPKGQRGLMAKGRGSSAQDLVFNVNYSYRNCADNFAGVSPVPDPAVGHAGLR